MEVSIPMTGTSIVGKDPAPINLNGNVHPVICEGFPSFVGRNWWPPFFAVFSTRRMSLFFLMTGKNYSELASDEGSRWCGCARLRVR